jgi:glycosyltransferase involved in cell wall biosynthesis
MKVALLSQPFDLVLPPEQTSLGLWTYEVGRRLGSQYETTILARRPADRPSRVQVDNVTIEYLGCLPHRLWTSAARAWTKLQPPRNPLFVQRFYAGDYLTRALVRLRRLSPDVVHIQNFPRFVPAVRKILPDAAVVLHMHCDWLVQLDRQIMRQSVVAADLVVGCSDHVVAAAAEHLGQLGTRFAVLPNGAPSASTVPNASRQPGKVVFVGRVSPEKGVHVLLKAWPRIVAACPEARLDIIGPAAATPRQFLVDLSDDPDVADLARFYPGGREFPGSYDAALRRLIPPDLAHTVTFVGHLPHGQVIERLAQAALLVNPSLSESFGMSLVEAMAVGTAVVATRVGGMPEIVEATQGGVLVEKNDPDALAAAVLLMLSKPEACAAMGRQGAQRVEALYAWPHIAALTRDLHREAWEKRRSRAGAAQFA